MEQHTLSLKQISKGQIIIESLIMITFLMGFLVLLQGFHFKARQQIQKERLSTNQIKKQAPWLKIKRRETK